MTIEEAPIRRRHGLGFWSFIALMLVLTAIFVGLGVWQVERLAWKEGLIAEVSSRLTQPPDPLPPVEQWAGLDLDGFDFHPVTASGHYLPAQTVLVFTSLTEPKGSYGGPGYWVMTPFEPTGGGTVFVNLGFVPQAYAATYAKGPPGLDQANTTITGVAVAAQAPGLFTPAPDVAHHVEWVRDPARLAAMADIDGPVLGLTVDAPARAPGALPQGGETVVDFPNNHFGYAITWFGLAILTPFLLGGWIWRQLRPRDAVDKVVPFEPPPDAG